MRSTVSRLHRSSALAPGALLALALAACNDGAPVYRTVTAPDPLPQPTLDAAYVADAVLLADTASAACGWRAPLGTMSAHAWWAVAFGETLSLTEESDPLDSYEYRGTLTGQDFVTKWTWEGRPKGSCELSEVWVSGRFAADFGAFEAHQAYVYGPPQNQTTTEYRWSARRR